MKSLSIWIIQSLLIMTVLSCSSSPERRQRMAVCEAIEFPQDAIVRPEEIRRETDGLYIPAKRYNALAHNAGDLARCLKATDCVLRIAEWERDCEAARRMQLEDSWMPGSMMPGSGCPYPKPRCEQ